MPKEQKKEFYFCHLGEMPMLAFLLNGYELFSDLWRR